MRTFFTTLLVYLAPESTIVLQLTLVKIHGIDKKSLGFKYSQIRQKLRPLFFIDKIIPVFVAWIFGIITSFVAGTFTHFLVKMKSFYRVIT